MWSMGGGVRGMVNGRWGQWGCSQNVVNGVGVVNGLSQYLEKMCPC